MASTLGGALTQSNPNNKKFDKYLVMKCTEEERKLTKENPISIDKAIKTIIGKKSYYEVKPLGSGLLLIEVDQKQVHDKFLQIKKLHNIPVSVSPHSSLNSSKGTIFCDNLDGMTDEQIREELEDQDVSSVYRIKKRDGEYTSLYILTFNVTTLPKTVKIGYMRCKVRAYIPKPRRCFNCQGYGHGKNTCSREPVCAKCAETGSEHPSYDDCEDDPKCCHCHGDHPASSRACPMYLLEEQIMERKIKLNLTNATAKEQVYSENPDLVQKIPGLKVKRSNNRTAYSAVTAAPSALEQQQKQFITQQEQFFIKQQHQMDIMQQQIFSLLNLLQGQSSQTAPSPMDQSFLSPSNNDNKKRSLSSDEEELEPTNKKAVSVRPELNMPAQSPPEQVGETPSVSGKTTPEGTGEEDGTKVGGNSPRRPSNPSSFSTAAASAATAAPSAAVPSASLGRNVKGGVSAGSSRSSEDKRSAVLKSNKKPTNKITGPGPSWK